MAEKKVMVQKQQIKMGDLARRSGFSVSTLYDYLRSGLLPGPEKESPTKAFFTQDHELRLKDIRRLKDQGLSMAEIKARFVRPEDAEAEDREPIDEVRVAIIDKALEMFSTYHYENTKISDITQALNIGNGTFYRYFKSKEELFLDCLERLPKVLVPRDAWAEVDKETDYIKRLKKRGYAMLNAFPSYIGILNYAKLALGGQDKVLARKAGECIRHLVRPLENELRQAMDMGYVRDVDVEMCAFLLLGINETFGYLLLLDPEQSVEKGFAVIEDFIGHALMQFPTPKPGRSLHVELTDRSGNVICLSSFSCGTDNIISGCFMDGELRISLHDLVSMSMDNTPETLVAYIELKNGEHLSMNISPNTEFSGQTPYGQFLIQAKKLKQIRVLDIKPNS